MDNMQVLTVAVSSRALFHIGDGDEIFQTQGREAFNAYMREKEHVPLRPGPAFGLVKKLLALNANDGSPRTRVEIILMSRNSTDAGLRVMESVRHYGLPIEQAVFCAGGDRPAYALAMGAHLFLSTSPDDVKMAINAGLAAATMMPSETPEDQCDPTIRIAFDGDSVLFSSEADEVFRAEGLDRFRESEVLNAKIPLGAGPFKGFLEALCLLQKGFSGDTCPVKLALVTARGMPAHARVIHTLRAWGVVVDVAIFAGGKPKGPLLRAFGADVFFDDTHKNVDSGRSHAITSCHVPFGTGHGIVLESPAATVA